MKLENRVALVTGSTSGIGKAIALAFAKEGARVVINGRDQQRTTNVAMEFNDAGYPAIPIPADVSDPLQVRELFRVMGEQLDPLSILVNNAGTVARVPIEKMTDAIWQKSLGVNLDSVFYCSREAVKVMKPLGRGKIINISTGCGVGGCANLSAYSAAKGGVNAFTRALAKELTPSGILVNAIAPGYVKTPIWSSYSDEELERLGREEVPLGRIGTPEDIAALALFLASDESDYIVGQVIGINGGMAVHPT